MSHRLSRSRSIEDWGAPPRSTSNAFVRRLRSRWTALVAVACLWLWWRRTGPVVDVVDDYYAKMSQVLKRTDGPQRSFRHQLADNVDFVMGLPFGGTGNQFLAMMNMLYIAKHTNRVGILAPINTDIHFKADLANVSDIYDIPRFVRESGVMAVQLSDVKRRHDVANELDSVQCWSLMEIKTGSANDHQYEAGWNEFKVFTNFWAVPKMNRTLDKKATLFEPVIGFLNDRSAQETWLDEVQRDFLPQMKQSHPVEPSANVKAAFDPIALTRPTDDDQLLCLDSCFWLGFEPPKFDETDEEAKRLSHKAIRKGQSWKEIGRYLHYTPEVERIADGYLRSIFDVPASAPVPPFIGIHIRRTDFANFKGHGLTPLESYVVSATALRERLQAKLHQSRLFSRTDPDNKPRLAKFDIPPSEYRVLVATDEPAGSDFRKEVDALGWKTINHDEMRTVERLGPWWPSKLDGELLGRAQGLVGTEWSSFSMLAGLRVEYWRGGEVVTAQRKYVETPTEHEPELEHDHEAED